MVKSLKLSNQDHGQYWDGVPMWRFIFLTMFTVNALNGPNLHNTKNKPKLKAMRVNGQISEVKQL